jgi:hypothetical protein
MKTGSKYQSAKRSADILKGANLFETLQLFLVSPSDKSGIKMKIGMEN